MGKGSKLLSIFLIAIMSVSVLIICSVSSFALASGDFEYEVISEDEKTVEITGYTGAETELEIPSVLEGYTVTSIGEYAFSFCESLTNITIPNTVTQIDDWAFQHCSALVNISIPDSVTTIGAGVFSNCGMLTSIVIPDSVVSIGDSSFVDCCSLTKINLSARISRIEMWTFLRCTSLESIIIPDGVTYISNSAFYDCKTLTSVTISNSVTLINSSAFSGCVALENVYYSGVKAEWEAIDIKLDNDYLKKATIHYHYGQEHNFGEWETVTSPTCTKVGSEKHTCLNCDEVASQEISALGHDFEEEYTIDVGPRTDGEAGWKSRHCTRCDETTDGKPVHDDTHTMSDSWREGEYLFSCMGYYYLDCLDCTYGIQKEDDMHGELVWNEVEASCTMDGFGEWICERCTGRIGELVIYEATGHNFSDWEVVEEATCETVGEEYRYCSSCWDGESREIPALGHDYGEWVVTTAPTVEKDGVETRICDCGEEETRVVNKLADAPFDFNNDGVVNSSDTGLFNCDGKWYYVNNGVFDFNYTGLVYQPTNGNWYYVEDGVLDWSFTGLVARKGNWYYVQNGKVNWSKTALVKHTNGNWYYVYKGKINFNYTGLVQQPSNKNWYYVQSGKINWSKTGLVERNGNWYYVQKGMLNWSKTGLVKHTNGNWYYVQKGKINFNYTGLVYQPTNGNWYYVQKGKINWGYTGYAYYNGVKYRVVKGVKV